MPRSRGNTIRTMRFFSLETTEPRREGHIYHGMEDMQGQRAVPHPVTLAFQPGGDVLVPSDKDREDSCHQHTSTNISSLNRKKMREGNLAHQRGRKWNCEKIQLPFLLLLCFRNHDTWQVENNFQLSVARGNTGDNYIINERVKSCTFSTLPSNWFSHSGIFFQN